MTTLVIHKNMIYADCKMTTVIPQSAISAKHFGAVPKEHESETTKIYLPPEGIDPALIKVGDSEILAVTAAGSVEVITNCVSLMWEHGFNYLYQLINHGLLRTTDHSAIHVRLANGETISFVIDSDDGKILKWNYEDRIVDGSGKNEQDVFTFNHLATEDMFLLLAMKDKGSDYTSYHRFNCDTRILEKVKLSKEERKKFKKRIADQFNKFIQSC